VAIAENSQERAKEANSLFRIPRSYTGYEELVEQPDIDAVTIALPNYLHAKVAIQALQARKHVLLEKPMATNARDAARIVAMGFSKSTCLRASSASMATLACRW